MKQVQTSAIVDQDLACSLGVEVQVDGEASELEVSLITETGAVIRKEKATGKVDWQVKDADLWWPVGEGAPTRYTVKVDLLGQVSLP